MVVVHAAEIRVLGTTAIEDYHAGRLGVIPEGAIMPHRG